MGLRETIGTLASTVSTSTEIEASRPLRLMLDGGKNSDPNAHLGAVAE